MELKFLIKVLKIHKKTIITLVLTGLFLSFLVYFIPSKYLATGSLFVIRSNQDSQNFFTYEGYYSQQTAVSYSGSVFSLAESIDVKNTALQKMGIHPNSYNIKQLERNYSVIKKGPQVITLEVKGKNPEEARARWDSLSNSIIELSDKAIKEGDSNLKIVTLSDRPLIRVPYKQLWVYSASGMIFGLAFGILFLSLKEYIKKSV